MLITRFNHHITAYLLFFILLLLLTLLKYARYLRCVTQQLTMVTRLPACKLARKPRMQPARFMGTDDSMSEQSENRVIVITSGKGGVGKTTTTANIGTSIAR